MTRRWRILRTALLPLAARHLATHKATTAIALVALAAGVASAVASQLVYRAVVDAYDAMATGFAGRAAIQVTNGTSGVPETLIDDVREVSGVRAVSASVEDYVSLADLPGERLYLYGVDLLDGEGISDGRGRDAIVADPIVFMAEGDSVALTRTFLARHQLAVDDRVAVLTPSGVAALTIRATLGVQRGVASALDGRVAVVDLSVAQALLKREGMVSQIAVEVAEGSDVDAVTRAVSRVVGSRGIVEPPRARTAAFARLLAGYRHGLFLAAVTALGVALHFVGNVAVLAVEGRRREIGLLRLVGLGTGGLGVLIMLELLVLAGIASAVGIPSGLALGRLLAETASATVATLYLDVGVPSPALDVQTVVGAIGLGIGLPFVAAIVPILRTRRSRPLDAAVPFVGDTRGSRGRSAIPDGCTILVASIGLWWVRGILPAATETVGLVTMTGALLGVAVAAPGIVVWGTHLAERVATRHLGATSQLATRALTADRRGVAVGSAAVLIGLAGALAIATWLTSLQASLDDAFDTVFANVDLVVSAGGDPFSPGTTRIDTPVLTALSSLPDVAHVDPLRVATVGLDGTLVAVVAADGRAYAERRRRLAMVEGDAASAAEAIAAGSGVVVNQTFARRLGRRVGDVIELATPDGALPLRIAGIHLEIAPGDLPVVRMDLAVYRGRWRDMTASLLEVALRPGADPRRVADAIRSRLAEHRLVVFTLADVRREYDAMLGQMARLAYPLLAVAIAVAMVGIVSARLTSLLGRVRLTGVLRAIGATRRQVTRTLMLETALAGGAAATLAVVAGGLLGALHVAVLLRGILGLSVEYAYPRAPAAWGGIAVAGLTGLAGWCLGRFAARVSVPDALRWE